VSVTPEDSLAGRSPLVRIEAKVDAVAAEITYLRALLESMAPTEEEMVDEARMRWLASHRERRLRAMGR
jgi:hypothetical protein